MKVFSIPTPSVAQRDNGSGIAQVVLHLHRHLPEFGVELVENEKMADMVAHHAGAGNGQTHVAHCHGLYPTAMRGFRLERWHWEANRRVIQDLRSAQPHITVPSQWVADILRRDMKLDPHVIAWAVDTEEWTPPTQHAGYVLWNKNRSEGVCDPSWVNRLAEVFPELQFITTFGDTSHNVMVTGKISHEKMRDLIQNAGVYLATTKETGDIGSREALACGVPVLGFRQGALPDFLEHGKEGFLAESGDFNGLVMGLGYILEYRDVLSQNARKKVEGYTWRNVAAQFAQLYRRVNTNPRDIKISVVIPCYNYANYIHAALNSVFSSKTDLNYEVIVVNDASTDNSREVIDSYPSEFKRIHLETNGGVANARNVGIEAARGEYIVCLDADDKIAPDFLQICAEALDRDRTLGIAYTRLVTFNDEGIQNLNPWPEEFNAVLQLQKQNRVPTCCMFRRDAWQRAGGFRGRYTPAEDAEFWTRIILLGYDARKVSDQGLFLYRLHEGSLSRTRHEPEWILDKAFIKEQALPFACPATPPQASWGVRNYDTPLVSIIIPVGPNHYEKVRRAVDSVERQSFWNWECIVVNDSHVADLKLPPYVRISETAGRGCGAGHARNLGLLNARGEFVVFLDADDELHPEYLARTLGVFKYSGAYIYTDMILIAADGKQSRKDTEEFDAARLFNHGAFHAITCLVPTHVAKQVGFDEGMSAFEDLKFFMGVIADAGLCGKRLAEPLLYYYVDDGNRRERGNGRYQEFKAHMAQTYGRWMQGDKPVCSCMDMVPAPQEGQVDNADVEVVMALYSGPTGNHGVRGDITRTWYGRHAGGEAFYIDKRDLGDPRFSLVAQVQMPARVTHVPEAPSYA